jgi:arylsulfatase A-like enzyme
MKSILLSTLILSSLGICHSAFAAKPNVLFLAVDDMRPELGCYGNKIIKTPNMDRLAARGMVFNHAYCQQAVCSPSRSSLLTGRRPDATRVWDLETHFRVALPDAITLPQHFKANGYWCSALSKIYHVGFEDGRSWNEPHWYPRGRSVDTDPVDWTKQIVTRHDVNVQEYVEKSKPDPADNDKPGKKANGKEGKSGPAFEVSPKPDIELPDGATAAEAVKRLHALTQKGQPFFFAVGFLKPHLPFVAPKKYWDLYDPEKIPLPVIDHLPEGAPEFAGHTNSELHNYQGVPPGNPIPADFAKTLRHGYYACISYTDAQIGKVLDALEAEGLADNTVIVLWGDHGWQLGDHGLWHKHTNFELATRAPLLISVPHQKTAGQKCDAPVEFVDVYPTLADVCGLAIPSGLDGASLKPFLENPAAPAMKVAVSQYPRSAGKAGGAVMGYSIRDERWRLTLWRERYGSKIIATELYDEKNDPAETVSLHDKPENKAIIESLSKHLPPVVTEVAEKKKKGQTKKEMKAKEAAANSPATSPAAADTSEDRGPRFDKLDREKTGKLTREYYITHQSDPKAAAERFDKWDTNHDGILTREEFVTQGGRHPDAK